MDWRRYETMLFLQLAYSRSFNATLKYLCSIRRDDKFEEKVASYRLEFTRAWARMEACEKAREKRLAIE